MNVDIIKLHDDVILPAYQTDGAAGMDIHAYLQEKAVILQPLERRMIPTGLTAALPVGYEIQIRARSGLSIKHGITMVNGIGTIDADYRGEIGVLVINLSSEPFEITHGMRIAQMVVARYERVVWREVERLSDSTRGTKGFGSTGGAGS